MNKIVSNLPFAVVSMASVLHRDNVEWTAEQEECAKKKVLENSQPLPPEKQGLDATNKGLRRFYIYGTRGSVTASNHSILKKHMHLCGQCSGSP